jgi:L-glyceraldehyde 3-phosphate reductase
MPSQHFLSPATPYLPTYYSAGSARYDQMPFRRAGRSGLLLPSISLGLWQNFGEADPIANSRSVLRRSFDLGITHFDLANNYGPPYGAAEKTFGEIFNADFRAYRDEMVISTKAGFDMWPGPYGEWGSRKYLIASLDQSLSRMGLEYVDIFYSHRPDPETPLEETMGALDHIVRQGKALYVGVSNYSPEQTLEASRILRSLGTPCLLHQPRYNMFDRHIEDGLLDVLRAEGIGCVVFSPLAQGLLTER